MIDREKVIEALHCRAYDDDFPCSICAYYRPDEKPVAKCDYRGLMDDAIALLKENEPQQAELRNTTWYCPRCKNPVTMFDYGEFNKYCGFCGQRVIF